MISLSAQKTLLMIHELHEERQLENFFYPCEWVGQWNCSDPSDPPDPPMSSGFMCVEDSLLQNFSEHHNCCYDASPVLKQGISCHGFAFDVTTKSLLLLSASVWNCWNTHVICGWAGICAILNIKPGICAILNISLLLCLLLNRLPH